jgi:hypothetical protein
LTDDDQTKGKAAFRPDPIDPTGGNEGPEQVVTAGVTDDESTVGTGSAIALGCIGATLVLIVLGLALLAVFALLR